MILLLWVVIFVMLSIVEVPGATIPSNARNNNTIYQQGYVDDGLDTAPVRREAETRREASNPNRDVSRVEDNILQHELIVSAPAEIPSQSESS